MFAEILRIFQRRGVLGSVIPFFHLYYNLNFLPECSTSYKLRIDLPVMFNTYPQFCQVVFPSMGSSCQFSMFYIVISPWFVHS